MSGPGIVAVLEPGDLMEEVRRRPVVYEDHHRRNRTSVEEAWIDISQQLGSDGIYEPVRERAKELRKLQVLSGDCAESGVNRVIVLSSGRGGDGLLGHPTATGQQTCKVKWYDLRNSYLGRRKRKFGNPLSSDKFHQYYELMGFLDSEAAREKDIDDSFERTSKAENAGSTAKIDAEMTDADNWTTPRIHLPPGLQGLFAKSRRQADAMVAVGSSKSVDFLVGDLDSDLHFLLSLLPLMKRLSPQDNLDIRIHIQSAIREKLFPNNSST